MSGKAEIQKALYNYAGILCSTAMSSCGYSSHGIYSLSRRFQIGKFSLYLFTSPLLSSTYIFGFCCMKAVIPGT